MILRGADAVVVEHTDVVLHAVDALLAKCVGLRRTSVSGSSACTQSTGRDRNLIGSCMDVTRPSHDGPRILNSHSPSTRSKADTPLDLDPEHAPQPPRPTHRHVPECRRLGHIGRRWPPVRVSPARFSRWPEIAQ
jgi:hypothetical protein